MSERPSSREILNRIRSAQPAAAPQPASEAADTVPPSPAEPAEGGLSTRQKLEAMRASSQGRPAVAPPKPPAADSMPGAGSSGAGRPSAERTATLAADRPAVRPAPAKRPARPAAVPEPEEPAAETPERAPELPPGTLALRTLLILIIGLTAAAWLGGWIWNLYSA